MNARNLLNRCLCLVACFVLFGSLAGAQADDTDEARIAAEKAKRRKYPGGRDEQELTVQAVLPATTRYPEAPKAAPAPTAAGSEAESTD